MEESAAEIPSAVNGDGAPPKMDQPDQPNASAKGASPVDGAVAGAPADQQGNAGTDGQGQEREGKQEEEEGGGDDLEDLVSVICVTLCGLASAVPRDARRSRTLSIRDLSAPGSRPPTPACCTRRVTMFTITTAPVAFQLSL
jgi:hypothetical protein